MNRLAPQLVAGPQSNPTPLADQLQNPFNLSPEDRDHEQGNDRVQKSGKADPQSKNEVEGVGIQTREDLSSEERGLHRAYVVGTTGRVPTCLPDRTGHETIVAVYTDGSKETFNTYEEAVNTHPDIDEYCQQSKSATGEQEPRA